MSTAPLPSSVVSFLRAHVDHVVKLRFLLAMHASPTSTSTVSLVSRSLDIPKSQVRDMANELVEERLLRATDDVLELALNIEERLALSDLATCYTRDRAAVLSALRGMGRGVDPE
jgi:DNA-binding IclR family transcriptional regulator